MRCKEGRKDIGAHKVNAEQNSSVRAPVALARHMISNTTFRIDDAIHSLPQLNVQFAISTTANHERNRPIVTAEISN
eukprot:4755667-Pyramimonas_sp.AAC.1